MLSRIIIVIVSLIVNDESGLVVHLLLLLGHLFNEWCHYAAILLAQLADDELQFLVHGHHLPLIRVGEGVDVGDSHEAVKEVYV